VTPQVCHHKRGKPRGPHPPGGGGEGFNQRSEESVKKEEEKARSSSRDLEQNIQDVLRRAYVIK